MERLDTFYLACGGSRMLNMVDSDFLFKPQVLCYIAHESQQDGFGIL